MSNLTLRVDNIVFQDGLDILYIRLEGNDAAG